MGLSIIQHWSSLGQTVCAQATFRIQTCGEEATDLSRVAGQAPGKYEG